MSGIATAIVGSAVIGGVVSSNAAKKASKTASEGSQAQIAYDRESRDMARADQTPYREAGYTALNALMSMTGLGGGSAAKAPQAPAEEQRSGPRGRALDATDRWGQGGANDPSLYNSDVPPSNFDSAYSPIRPRAAGGPMGRGIYNVNELGPENVYQGGAMTRNSMPKTIAPTQGGYVQPNIQGRAWGGVMAGTSSLINQYANNRGPIKNYAGNQVTNTGFDGNLSGGPNAMPSGFLGGATPTGGLTAPGSGSVGQGWLNGGNRGPNQPAQSGQSGGYTGTPENPGGVEGGYNFMTDPGYNFRLNEGMRGLEAGAAARGGLLSGGFGRRAIRYGQDYASNEYSNVYNRISNIAGLGQVSAGQSGNYAMQAGMNMGNAASEGANSSAYGQMAQGNAWANAANQAAQAPWGQIFGSSGGSGAAPSGFTKTPDGYFFG